ncbi:hypothetical protein [Paraliomyxa miuraensis]|uniref:hypothetical protein n=1 Tax=Paraliomyxa miuraensis TaxID=376150 RepID=UPI002256CF2A|nr:hypothetical protein [Paraliomyxa miuraensis]MCX4242588.1 hypothetical protein [Paraliomyxa miuraensis]
MSAKVVFEDDALQLATWSRVFINRWRTAATKRRLTILRRHQLELIDSVDDRRIAVITILEDETGLLPPADARKEAEEIARITRDAVMLQAQIVEGRGFVAAALRAVLAGVALAARAPHPIKVFGTLEDGLPWIQQQLRRGGYHDDARGVSEVLIGLRRG